MSVWSECTMTVYISKHAHCSIRQILSDHLEADELMIRSYEQREFTHSKLSVTTNFVFSLDGFAASDMLKRIFDMIRSYDKSATVDCNAQLRFLQ